MTKDFKKFGTIMNTSRHMRAQYPTRQCGASLIVVMMILIIVSLLGVGGAQIALMSERGARNDRDMQVAWQAAEAALIEAEADMLGATRKPLFDGKTRTGFLAGCGTSGTSIGLCDIASSGKPAWLTVDFTNTASNAPTTAFGAFTGNSFKTGTTGVQPYQLPRYIIELVEDPFSKSNYVYRVTAMGFGPRQDIQAVMQMIYRTLNED
jgi:type IV pilus assembly protein PilX